MKYKIKFLLILLLFISAGCKKNYLDIMAVTGATPKALSEDMPKSIELRFDGMVKRDYVFTGDALKALASARVRVEETDAKGIFLGTYAYTGIPVHNLLEGIAPSPLNKKEKSLFDRLKSSMLKKLSVEKTDEYPFHPSDILVTFYSRSGQKAFFSYGELVFTDDKNPALLAFHRRELRSDKEPDKYNKNIYKDNIKGLRLVCPADSDNSRYLDDVVKITYSTLPIPDSLLPRVRSYKEAKLSGKCSSDTITCIDGKEVIKLDLKGYNIKKFDHWIRFSHGHGFQSISSAEGVSFREILHRNFKDINLNEFFLVAGCDGYRALISSREIFDNENGEFSLIVKKIDNGPAPGKLMFSPVKDFYMDRDVWGVTNIVRLKAPGAR